MKRYGLIIILLLAAAVRLYALGAVPPGPSLDEVSLGYNAYSILKTGKDEFGTRFPVLLRAYDDFRPALYVYLVVPFVALLGLVPAAVRLPSVVLGILSVYMLYRLASLLVPKQKLVAPIAAFLLAVSPWHVYLSHLGHEVNLGFATTLGALWMFMEFIRAPKRHGWLYGSAVLFGLSLWAYQSQKLIMPLLVFVFACIYRKELWLRWRTVLVAALFAVVIALPAVVATFSSQGLIRLSGTTAFSGDHPYYAESVERYAQAISKQNLFEQFYYSRKVTHLRVFGANYLSHFSPDWLFYGEARENHKVPFTGLLYLFEAPFLLYGAWVALTKLRSRDMTVVFALLLLSPLPAAVTTQAPHAMRAYTMLPSLVLLTSLGFVSALGWIRSTKPSWFGLARLAVIPLLLALVAAGKNYFIVFPTTQSDSFQYALREALVYAIAHEGEVDKVIVSNEHNLYQSYMFYLFTRRYDPATYLAGGGTVSGGYAETHTIGTWEFRPIVWEEDGGQERALLLANPGETGDAEPAATFANRDGTVGVVAIQTP